MRSRWGVRAMPADGEAEIVVENRLVLNERLARLRAEEAELAAAIAASIEDERKKREAAAGGREAADAPPAAL